MVMLFQIDGNGNKADKHSGSLKDSNWAKPLSNFVANNFLPLGDFITLIFEIFMFNRVIILNCISCVNILYLLINVCVILCAALVGGVALGFANPNLGCLADSYSLSKFSTFGIFIISG